MQQIAQIPEQEPRTLVHQAAYVLGAALGYYVFCVIGTVISVPPSGYAIIWPATAFLIGVLLLTPVRYWWTYLLGVVPAHLLLVATFQHPPAPPLVAASQIAGNVVLAAANALAVRRTNQGPLRFDSFRNMLVFIVVASLAVPSLVDALVLCLYLAAGWTHYLWLSWRQFMLGSIFPTVTLTPLMVLAAQRRTSGDAPTSRFEVLALSLALFGLTYLAFGPGAGPAYLPELLLLPLPIMLWAAVRWGPAGASLALLLFAAAIIARALNGVGPFAAGASAISVLSLQVYLTAISVSLMLLAALSEERRRGLAQLLRSESRMEIAAASTDTGLWQWDVAGDRLWTTEHCRSMFGLAAEAALTPQAFVDAVELDDRPILSRALAEAQMAADARTREFRVRRGDGAERWLVMHTHAEFDAGRRPVRVSGVFRDVTQRVAAQRQAAQVSQRLLTLQEDERKNIAEALHDTTTQHLVAAGLTIGMIERRVEASDEARVLLDDARAQLAQATNELRAFTYLLRPPELEAQGLGPVLRRYVEGFGLRTGIKASTRLCDAVGELPIEQQRALLRIVQESLANVYRHAAASHVLVSLRRHADHLHLVVRDDGRGIQPGESGEGAEPVRLGVGIPGMSARIRQLGGKFDIRSGPRGATVHVALPLAP